MIKRPKRDLKVKSIYDQPQNTEAVISQNPQSVFQIPQPSPVQQPTHSNPITVSNPFRTQQHQAPPLPTHQVDHKQVDEPESITHSYKQPPQPSSTIPSNPILEISQPKPQLTEADSKKSKIQELKQRYLKKNLNPNPQPTVQPRGVNQQPKKQVELQQITQTKNQQPANILPVTAPFTHNNQPTFNPNPTPVTQPQSQPEKQTSPVEVPYQTDFRPIIEQKVKAKPPPPPPTKRQIGGARNPFQLKGTYARPQQKQQHVPQQPVIHPTEQSHPQPPTFNQQTIVTYPQPLHFNPITEYRQHQVINTPSSQPIPLVYSNLTANPEAFITELHSNNLITESLYNLSQQRLYERLNPQHSELEAVSNHPQFNTWVSRLFTASALKSPTIDNSNAELIDDILNQFFLPLGQEFSALFIVALSKLPQQYYTKYQNYLLSNPDLYINIISKYSHYISKAKITEFLSFIQQHLNQSSEHYVDSVLTMYLLSPETINEASLNNLVQCCDFPHASLLLQILSKQKTKYIRQNIQIANIVVKQLEQNKETETGLELLKQLNEQLGTPAYSLLKEVRERLMKNMTEPQQKDSNNQAKNVASNFFGFLSKAIDIIKSPNETQQPKPVQKQPPVKENFYYCHQKKRYVINGEIPDDEEEEVVKEVQAVPPPQAKSIPAPPPAPVNPNGNKRPNRIPANRYV